MLQLQRASAGSGKTYTLAKKFIEYFISVKEGDKERRLRSPHELRDALPKILAITFTNKATNEMKLRIVSKLDALASWSVDIPVWDVDYLADFSEQFNCSPHQIAFICGKALRILLSEYGDFKVSTIDSFFQTVLRTFAYEADLDDTYQLELDSNYVAQMGLDTTLDSIDTDGDAANGAEWINKLMQNKATSGKGWNIFQKNSSGSSVYGQVLQASRNLAKEDFKEIREKLDDYFERNPDFYHTYHSLCRIYEGDLSEKTAVMSNAAKALRKAFSDANLDIKEFAGTYLATRADKMINRWDEDFALRKSLPAIKKEISFKLPEFTRKGATSRVFHPGKNNPYLGSSIEDKIERLAIEMYDAFDLWRQEVLSDKLCRWRIYNMTLPYVGLLQNVRANSRLFLTDSNTIELAETNSILSRIIGEDDAPFIYERLGSRLRHFLIDEFQDTSRLQWNNLYPLLAESESKGNDNLIIGDAKQSIYRFRNADPSLITTKVPEQFSDTVRECGTSPTENTNWRSSRRIVEFNNLFFRFFTRELSPEMEKLYQNTVQPARHSEDYGFVKIQLFQGTAKSEEDIPAHFMEIPVIINDMLDRGYGMRDIAVLVDTHVQGNGIIQSIMAYNRREETTRKIDFISADSLNIDESPAVQSIVSILEAINNGTRTQLRPREEWKSKGVCDWSTMKADFSLFINQHHGLSLSECFTQFLAGRYNPDAINDMLAEMTVTVLPALVENIIRNFITDRMRESEAPFLAAFMDSVLEFCESSTADITSFLTWWNAKGHSRSIASPEDADAVQIMTVHKSKGLEFRCVIVPYSKQTVVPMGVSEWLWVQPDLSEATDIVPIPYIPVWSSPQLKDTIHASVYEDYLSKYLADKVNMAYVAYTRAIDELYIYSPITLKDGDIPNIGTSSEKIGEYLWECGVEADRIISNLEEAYHGISNFIPSVGSFVVDQESLCWTYGEVPTREQVLATSDVRKKKESAIPTIEIAQYKCFENIPSILYSNPISPDEAELPLESEPEEEFVETEETRIYGELMHRILQTVRVPEDISKSVVRLKTAGFFGKKDADKYTEELNQAIDQVKDYGWFEPGLKLLNERGIAMRGKMLRPDRVILYPDGKAVIVDYKFGSHRNDTSYRRQLARYSRALIASGVASSCESFIWYVSLRTVVKV